MPHATFSPSLPTRAVQRGGEWSVPRKRHKASVSGKARAAGTRPPCSSDSNTEKSTRKQAQHAPQDWQWLMNRNGRERPGSDEIDRWSDEPGSRFTRAGCASHSRGKTPRSVVGRVSRSGPSRPAAPGCGRDYAGFSVHRIGCPSPGAERLLSPPNLFAPGGGGAGIKTGQPGTGSVLLLHGDAASRWSEPRSF